MTPTKPQVHLSGLSTKPDYETCMARIEAWYGGAVLDRAPVRFYRHNAQFEAGEPLDRSRWQSLEDRWFDTEYQVESFEASVKDKVFHAETFPLFSPNLGPNVYSAFYGGAMDYAETTSWYEPVIADIDDLSPLQNDPFASRYFRKIDELTNFALQRCGDRYWVGYTDLHPGLDCVYAWLGVDNLFVTMASEPEKLGPILDLSVRDFHRIFDHYDAMLRAKGHPSGTWMNIPCTGKFHVPSCDASSMISTEHFKEFSLPSLRNEVQGMDRVVYHVDGKGVAQHLEVILEQPEIQAIQWVQGLGRDWPIMQWLPLLKRVRAAGKSLLLDVPLEELDAFMAAMPPEGIFLCLGVPEGQEAAVLKRVEKWARPKP